MSSTKILLPQHSKIEYVSVAALLAELVKVIHLKGSITEIFNPEIHGTIDRPKGP